MRITVVGSLNHDTTIVGCVGQDREGEVLVASLRDEGVEVTHVSEVEEPTGSAFPIVSPDDVRIIVHAGANGAVTPAHVDAAATHLTGADVVLLQGEIGAAASRRAAELVSTGKATLVFNPAPPVSDVIEAVLPHASVLVVNRSEQSVVQPPAHVRVVVTLGAEGALVDGHPLAAYPTEVTDPTGAGDAFCAGLAVGLAEGADRLDAARMGAAAGSLPVRIAGAQPSFPGRAAVDALLQGDEPETVP